MRSSDSEPSFVQLERISLIHVGSYPLACRIRKLSENLDPCYDRLTPEKYERLFWVVQLAGQLASVSGQNSYRKGPSVGNDNTT